jgi:hypothetical protein
MVFKNSQAIMQEALATFVIGHLAKIGKIKLRVRGKDDPSARLRFLVEQFPQPIPVKQVAVKKKTLPLYPVPKIPLVKCYHR